MLDFLRSGHKYEVGSAERMKVQTGPHQQVQHISLWHCQALHMCIKRKLSFTLSWLWNYTLHTLAPLVQLELCVCVCNTELCHNNY